MQVTRHLARFGFLFLCVAAGAQKPRLLRAETGHNGSVDLEGSTAPSLQIQQYAGFRAHFVGSANVKRASLYLVAEAYAAAANNSATETLTLRIPLANTEEAYGESRICTAKTPTARQSAVFTAGLDERNFISFAGTAEDHTFRILLNKYLCRALATSFHCGSAEFLPTRDVSAWHIRQVRLELQSDAPVTLSYTGAASENTTEPFDYAQCAVIAPSNGLCCVQHKTTEWHCGGSPAGDGWHQVSGDCFHRETGGTCKE